jgi:hypothetical protein
MERSEIRGERRHRPMTPHVRCAQCGLRLCIPGLVWLPDCASRHPGYEAARVGMLRQPSLRISLVSPAANYQKNLTVAGAQIPSCRGGFK